ncbi:PE family protein, partial [Mycobacterium marinum]
MSYVFATPELVAAAATDLAGVQSVLSAANSAAAGPTMAVMAAGADEVSALIAGLFDAHAQAYQALSAQALVFHDQFVQMLNAGASSYAAAEAANASPLQVVQNLGQNVLAAVNAPTQAVLGRPLIGDGANGSPNTGADGGAGGLLYGNGGNGGSGGLAQAGGNGGAAGLIG